MYIIPIITSCAFSKTAVTRSVKYSTTGIILYAVVQTLITKSSYYIQISIVTELLVVFSTFITININNQFHHAFNKMVEAMEKSNDLTDKLHTDTLTGSLSREKLEIDMKLSENPENESDYAKINSIAFIDIDNFKKINDKFGHDKGDFVLSKFVQVMLSEDINIYRLGGDEFLISSSLTGQELYERLVYKTSNFKYETKKCFGQSVTISCGIINAKNFSQEEINRADKFMYSIKHTGKNLIKVLEESE